MASHWSNSRDRRIAGRKMLLRRTEVDAGSIEIPVFREGIEGLGYSRFQGTARVGESCACDWSDTGI